MVAVYGNDSLFYDTDTRWKRNFQTGHICLRIEVEDTCATVKDQKSTCRFMLSVLGDCCGIIYKLYDVLIEKWHNIITKGNCFLDDNAFSRSSKYVV
ncbi:hypothetical protein TNCV_3779881 [Trichonephila clavipes]|nr:hypothetical protein TNCV_3779881 [Trichonephila clavipes]